MMSVLYKKLEGGLMVIFILDGQEYILFVIVGIIGD